MPHHTTVLAALFVAAGVQAAYAEDIAVLGRPMDWRALRLSR